MEYFGFFDNNQKIAVLRVLFAICSKHLRTRLQADLDSSDHHL